MGDQPSPKCPCPDCRSALKAQGVASTRDQVDAGMVARATDWCADKQNQKARTATFQNIDRVFGLCLDTTPLIKEKPVFIELTSEATSFCRLARAQNQLCASKGELESRCRPIGGRLSVPSRTR